MCFLTFLLCKSMYDSFFIVLFCAQTFTLMCNSISYSFYIYVQYYELIIISFLRCVQKKVQWFGSLCDVKNDLE